MPRALDPFETELLAARPRMKSYAQSLCRNSVDAEDMVQDAIERALRHRDTFQPGSNMQAWLNTIMFNSYIGGKRKRKREVEDVDGMIAETVLDENAADVEARSELAVVLHALQTTLPPKQRQIVYTVLNEESYEGAAAALSIPIGTVKSQINRARTNLKKAAGETREPLQRKLTPEQRAALLAAPTRLEAQKLRRKFRCSESFTDLIRREERRA